ncbi:MAG: ATP-binding cassette domain-containing protein [Lachnospiraceae bacterium]|nr:ATP-binding cassette domain-containing protein [Lachnospiraceae bacterium]
MKTPIISGKNIVKTFGETKVLNEINIEIYDGDFTVIMGTSGSGKSTLLYCLSGMEQATEGTILYGDRNITGASEKELTKLRADEFGFVFQKTHLVSNLTLYENIVMAGLIGSRLGEKEVKERAKELALQMNLQDAVDRLPSQTSGGEAQRAAVARAVMGSPAVLFADEPTGALNKANTKEVLNMFTDLHEKGQTILLVTHDKEAALRGNRILYIEDGRVISELMLSEYGKLPSGTSSCGNDLHERSDDTKNLYTNDDREKKLAAWLEGLGW